VVRRIFSDIFLVLELKKRLRNTDIGYGWESQKERDHWEDQDVGWWTILKWILER
jgi:hypothetical protein